MQPRFARAEPILAACVPAGYEVFLIRGLVASPFHGHTVGTVWIVAAMITCAGAIAVILRNNGSSRRGLWIWAIGSIAGSFLGPLAFLLVLARPVRANLTAALFARRSAMPLASQAAGFIAPQPARAETTTNRRSIALPRTLDETFVVRARPLTFVVVVLSALFLSLVFVGGGLAIALDRRHADLIWALALSGSIVGAAMALRLRARFTSTGIEARNALRSYSAGWDQIAAIGVISAVWYCADPGWYAAMLRVDTTDGRSFPLRVCTHLSRSQVERLTALLKERGKEYGFETPPSLFQLWKVTAAIE